MKFTFKRHARETGLAGVANPNPDVDIKINKKVVGMIVGPNWMTKDGLWCIRFMKKDGDKWKWVSLKKRCETEEEARQFLADNVDRFKDFDFHFMED